MAKVPKAILWGGLICGTLDITAACIDVAVRVGMNPLTLLQAVASALVGPAAFHGGLPAAALGLAMHFTVAYSATAVFYLLSRRFPAVLRWAVVSGLVYGAVVFLFMYRVTYPLTIELRSLYLATPFSHDWPKLRWSQLGVHLLCVGLPIALTVRAYAPRPAAR